MVPEVIEPDVLRWLITPSDATVYVHFGILPRCDEAPQSVVIDGWTCCYRRLATGMYALELDRAATPAEDHTTWPSLPVALYTSLRKQQGAQRLNIGGDLL